MSDIHTTETERQPIERRRPWTRIEDVERRRTRLSWGAIFAGAAVAVVLSFVLNLLGFGIGAVALDPTEAGQARALGIGAAIWTFLATIIALFVGGWMAGRLSSSSRNFEGALHGLVTWSIVTLAVLWLVGSTIGTVVGGAFGLVGETAPAAAEQAQQQDIGKAQQQLQEGAPSGQQAQQMAGQAGDIAGSSAIVLAVAMALGGVASAGGGAVASRRRRKEELESAPEPVH